MEPCNVVQKQVSTRDYNYRQATEDMNTLVDATRGMTTYGRPTTMPITT
jgi:type VI secretion system secreted protein VgrG